MLDGNNYKGDGHINVQTDIPNSINEKTFSFYLGARHGSSKPYISGRIEVRIGCYGVTKVTGTYHESNPIHTAFIANKMNVDA